MTPRAIRRLAAAWWARRVLVGCFALAAIFTATAWYFLAVFVPHERAAAIEVWRGRVSAMADDRKVAITAWLNERIGDASVVSESPATVDAISGQGAGTSLSPRETAPAGSVQRLLDSMQHAYAYHGLYVVAAGGETVLTGSGSPALEASCGESIGRVLASGAVVADFYAGDDGSPIVVVAAPVRAFERTVGAIVLSIDPRRWLYPLLLSEPTPTATGESLLTRRLGDEVQFLSPLRHHAGPPLSLRMPMRITPLIALAAIRGEEKFMQYLDYRGVRVLGVGRRIPGTGWGLVVKVDEDEALATFRRTVAQSAVALLSLFAALAALGFGAWRMEVARHRAQLDASEARFALLRDHANDAIVFTSRRGVIQEANRRAEEFFGRSREELIGTTLAELRAPGERAALPGQLDAVARGEQAVFETVHLRRDGTQFPVEVSTRRVEVAGEPAFLSIIRDVTERKRAEAALRASEERFRTLFEQAPIGIYRTTPDGRILLANPALLHMLRYDSLEELARRNLQNAGFQPDHPRQEFQETLARDGEVQGLEAAWTAKDGRVVFVLENARAIRGPDGTIAYYEGTVEDITERKRAEEALRTEQERFRLAAESSVDVIYEWDIGEKIEWFGKVDELMGYSPGEFPRTLEGWAHLLHPEDREKVTAAVERQLKGEAVYNIEYRIGKKDGTYGHWSARGTVIRNASSEPCRWIGSITDITERKRAEEEIHRLNAELEERVRQRTAQLEVANKELEAFSYSVSHDLRAPLRAIDGFARIVLEDHAERLGGEGLRQLGVIRTNIRKMGRLIDDLLAFSRAGRAELRRTEVDMKALVHSVFHELVPAEDEHARIDFSVGDLTAVWADAALIRQVWLNLLGNAVKFSRPRARAAIHVGTSVQNRRIVYHVKDNGVGFDMRYADKLFGVFQRLHSNREFEGTGVGLALVQRIIHRHGGDVWGEGAVDGGATFSFALPEEGSHE